MSNTILGDLSYKTAGSQYKQSGVFEVVKAEAEDTAGGPSTSAGGEGGEGASAGAAAGGGQKSSLKVWKHWGSIRLRYRKSYRVLRHVQTSIFLNFLSVTFDEKFGRKRGRTLSWIFGRAIKLSPWKPSTRSQLTRV